MTTGPEAASPPTSSYSHSVLRSLILHIRRHTLYKHFRRSTDETRIVAIQHTQTPTWSFSDRTIVVILRPQALQLRVDPSVHRGLKS